MSPPNDLESSSPSSPYTTLRRPTSHHPSLLHRIVRTRRLRNIALTSLLASVLVIGLLRQDGNNWGYGGFRSSSSGPGGGTFWGTNSSPPPGEYPYNGYGEGYGPYQGQYDHLIPPTHPRHKEIVMTLLGMDIKGDTPFPGELVDAGEIFPDVRVGVGVGVEEVVQPREERFPREDFGEWNEYLYPIPSHRPTKSQLHLSLHASSSSSYSLPDGAFVNTWTSPSWFDPSHKPPHGSNPMPRVQYDFEGERGKGWETEEERKVREGRRDAVRRGFVWAWGRYKEQAWGHDEVRPVSGRPSDPFQNWGATIIDSLETLLIMNLTAEYNLCRRHVNMVDFRLVNGRDWKYGYRPSGEVLRAEVGEEVEVGGEGGKKIVVEEWMKYPTEVGRDHDASIASFEMGIRYLGGLIGAYDLSSDPLLLTRARELGYILGKGFDTPSGMVMGRFDAGLGEGEWYNSGRMGLAEVGSMTLELTRLSQVTGERWFFDRAQRALDYIEQVLIPRSSLSPLLPTNFDSQVERTNIPVNGEYSFGGQADSYYEYLIKQHQLIGGATDQFSKMYGAAMDKAEKELFMDVDVVPGEMGLFTIGKAGTMQQRVLEHLTCFAGAMLGLGAKLLGREKDMDYGERLTRTCYWAGASTATGLQPEIINFFGADEPWAWENVTIELSGYGDGGEVDYLEKEVLRGIPPGAKSANRVYIGRPETAESVFYMYRLTGDKKWQDRGWRMFTSWIESCTTEYGLSSVGDVGSNPPHHTDNMESFVFAETFKYYYLLQSEPDLISLDDYVFTTEAHPILLRNAEPGVHGFWHTRPDDPEADLGEQGSGADAQLWVRKERMMAEKARLERLAVAQGYADRNKQAQPQPNPPFQNGGGPGRPARLPNRPPPGGGKGMGGGPPPRPQDRY